MIVDVHCPRTLSAFHPRRRRSPPRSPALATCCDESAKCISQIRHSCSVTLSPAPPLATCPLAAHLVPSPDREEQASTVPRLADIHANVAVTPIAACTSADGSVDSDGLSATGAFICECLPPFSPAQPQTPAHRRRLHASHTVFDGSYGMRPWSPPPPLARRPRSTAPRLFPCAVPRIPSPWTFHLHRRHHNSRTGMREGGSASHTMSSRVALGQGMQSACWMR